VADAKNKLPELIKAVEDGETVTIYRRGVPAVDIIRTKSLVAKSEARDTERQNGGSALGEPSGGTHSEDQCDRVQGNDLVRALPTKASVFVVTT